MAKILYGEDRFARRRRRVLLIQPKPAKVWYLEPLHGRDEAKRVIEAASEETQEKGFLLAGQAALVYFLAGYDQKARDVLRCSMGVNADEIAGFIACARYRFYSVSITDDWEIKFKDLLSTAIGLLAPEKIP